MILEVIESWLFLCCVVRLSWRVPALSITADLEAPEHWYSSALGHAHAEHLSQAVHFMSIVR
jgi:hypothetical protein